MNSTTENQNAHVIVVDAICGTGKTSAAINYMNEHPEKRYLYITPFLTEIERVKKSCPDRKFTSPSSEYGTKIRDINRLIDEGRNIASTHALFSMFNKETIEAATLHDYVLIMDEVANVIEPVTDIKQKDYSSEVDAKMIIEKGYLEVNKETGKVSLGKAYTGKLYSDLIQMAANGCLYMVNDKLFLWLFPVEIFKIFKEVYILTYMFEAQMQCFYYKFFNVKWENWYIKDFHFTKEKQNYPIDDYTKLINILNNDKMNALGHFDTSLSKTWYKHSIENNDRRYKQIRNNTINYFINICHSKTEQNMWTVFKNYKLKLSGKGYAKGFVPCTSRATNEFKDRTNLAYLINVFMNPLILNFFKERGVQVDTESYALSEMLQWIFRSALRDKKPINIYIPSSRMRNLLISWMNHEKINPPSKEVELYNDTIFIEINKEKDIIYAEMEQD